MIRESKQERGASQELGWGTWAWEGGGGGYLRVHGPFLILPVSAGRTDTQVWGRSYLRPRSSKLAIVAASPSSRDPVVCWELLALLLSLCLGPLEMGRA